MGGCVLKLVDAVLFLFFLLIAVVAPLIDAQTCLPLSYFPDILVQLKEHYTKDYGDYLVAEKPHFFVGLVWLELLFQWPLALLSLYAILTSKPWFNTTCLIYGVSVTTSMVIYLSPFNSYFSSSKFLFFPFKTFVLRNSPASKIAKNTFVYLSIYLSITFQLRFCLLKVFPPSHFKALSAIIVVLCPATSERLRRILVFLLEEKNLPF